MSQCLSTCTAYATWKALLYTYAYLLFAVQIALFLDITSNCNVGFCLSYLYARKTNEHKTKTTVVSALLV